MHILHFINPIFLFFFFFFYVHLWTPLVSYFSVFFSLWKDLWKACAYKDSFRKAEAHLELLFTGDNYSNKKSSCCLSSLNGKRLNKNKNKKKKFHFLKYFGFRFCCSIKVSDYRYITDTVRLAYRQQHFELGLLVVKSCFSPLGLLAICSIKQSFITPKKNLTLASYCVWDILICILICNWSILSW